MKKILLLSFLLSIFSFSFSQKYLDKISEEACKCLDGITDTTDINNIKMSLGVCMLKAAIPYKKQLKKDYKINLDLIDEYEGKKLGQILAIRMADVCPDKFLALSQSKGITKENIEEGIKSNEENVRGIITKVETNCFVIFSIKDINEHIKKYYWLTYIRSNKNFPDDYQLFKDRYVSIVYIKEEFFDPRINDYREFRIIKEINFTDK